ncbi:MAG: HAMP domain-containing protein [Actinobacteria bacterium]|nr:MAG: HAMP domain-containing protein [Actinomycetota bacterium]
MVEVAVTEEHRGGIRADHHLGTQPAHEADERLPQLGRVVELAVGVAQAVMTGQPERARRRRDLLGPALGEGARVHRRVERSLVARRADGEMHLRARRGPTGERATARDLGVVGMGVDGERAGRSDIDEIGHGRASVPSGGWRTVGGMATAPGVDLQRFARAIRARVAGANIVGATLVFLYFGLFPSTGVTGGARGMHTTIVSLVTFGAYMAFTGLIAFNYGPRTGRAALSWLFEGRLPTPAEREVALREPWRNSVWPFSAWAGAAVVFGPILQWNLHNPATQSLRVAVVVLLGGLTTCSLTFLLLERVFRPIFAIALAGEPPERPLTLGVRPRLLLSWALGSAVPLIALGTAPIGLDAHKRAQLTAPLVFLSLLGLFVGGVAVYLAARTVADPLEGVRAALGLVGAGQLDVVLPVDDAGEVGLVQAGFNHMATGLREREHLRDLFGRHVGVEVARQSNVRQRRCSST